MKLIWEISCLIQLKMTANSHVFLLLSMDDLWLRKRTLNSVDVDPTYCNLHLLHEAKYTTYLDEHVNLWLILYIRPVAKLLKLVSSIRKFLHKSHLDEHKQPPASLCSRPNPLLTQNLEGIILHVVIFYYSYWYKFRRLCKLV